MMIKSQFITMNINKLFIIAGQQQFLDHLCYSLRLPWYVCMHGHIKFCSLQECKQCYWNYIRFSYVYSSIYLMSMTHGSMFEAHE